MRRNPFRLSVFCRPLALVLLAACQAISDTSTAPRQVAPAGLVPAASRHALLAAAIAGADRIVVLRVGAAEAEPMLEARGPRVAEEFLAHVQIDDFAGDFRCDCGPALRVEFFHGDARLAELTVRRHERWYRWHDGAWPGDAAARGKFPQQSFHDWFKLRGGELMRLQAPGAAAGAIDELNEQDRRFAEYFPEPARNIARWVGMVTRDGFVPWSEDSELANLVPDRMALATATFRALGMVRRPWHSDDYRVAATQTATAALTADDFVRALALNAADDQAMRGAARVYFRMSVHRRLSPSANAEWLPRLADAMLRTGRRMDLAKVLLYVAATREEAGWRLLREIATGARSYSWPTLCTPTTETVHEPSLRPAAAVLLALSGDRGAPRLAAAAPHTVPGLDQAAAEIAAALVDPNQPLRAAHFRYGSYILTYAATEAASRRPAEAIPASVLGSALLNNDYSFNRGIVRRLFPLAERFDLQLLQPLEVSLAASPVPHELVRTDPEEAIRQCTEGLPGVSGNTRTATLLLRALAHEALDHVPEAIADFEAALKAGGFTGEKIYFRVALLYFRAARLIDAFRNVELGLQAKPDADLFCLRGMIRYAGGDFGPDADLDFTASLALQRNHGYAEIFQHLCAHLSGRPRLSRLRGKAEYEVPPPNQILIGPGPSLSLDFSGGAIAPWPAAIIAFLRDDICPEQLLETARAADPATQRIQIAEAYFYLSQGARISRDTARERDYLDRCPAQKATEVAEHRLAEIRRNSLR